MKDERDQVRSQTKRFAAGGASASGTPRLESSPTRRYDGGPRSWAIVLRGGDETMTGLTEFVKTEGIRGGHLSAIGAFSSAELAFFDRSKREYVHIPIDDQTECLSLNGTIGIIETGEPMLHVHCTAIILASLARRTTT